MRRASRACGSPCKLGKVPTVRHHTSRFPQVPHPTSSSSPGKGSQTTRPLSICRVPVPVKPVQPARYWRRLRRFAVNTLPGCCVCWCRRAPARTCLQVPHRTSKILRLCPAATKWAHLTKILRPILSSDPDCFFAPPPPVVVDVTTASHFAPPRPLAKPARRPPAPACDCARPGVAAPA